MKLLRNHVFTNAKAAPGGAAFAADAQVLFTLERLTVGALIFRGVQFVSTHVDCVQSAIILSSVMELALMHGTFDGFVDFVHFLYLLCTICTGISMAEIQWIIDTFSKFSP